MANPKLEQDWPAESTIIIDEDDIPDIPERPWNRPPAPAANAPASAPEVTRPMARRVETPEDRRARTVADLDSETEAAALALAQALAWCRSINYHSEVTEPLTAAAELVSKAQGLVDALEGRT